MFYIIYKTINHINEKIYVGVHFTENLEIFDGYLGSGDLIKLAIKKYGKENFTRKILFVFETSEEAYLKERRIVTPEFVAREDTYNLRVGGIGSAAGENNSNYGKRGKDSPNYGKHRTKEFRKKNREANGMTSEVIAQRREDIENIEKVWGWKSEIARKWETSHSAVFRFIKKYASDLEMPFSEIIRQRREDIKNIEKIWGWKVKIARKWKTNHSSVIRFIKKHASDLMEVSSC